MKSEKIHAIAIHLTSSSPDVHNHSTQQLPINRVVQQNTRLKHWTVTEVA